MTGSSLVRLPSLDEIHRSTFDDRCSALKGVMSILFELSPVLDEPLILELASEPPPLTIISSTGLIDRSATIVIRSWPPALRSHRYQPFRRSFPWSIYMVPVVHYGITWGSWGQPDPKIVGFSPQRESLWSPPCTATLRSQISPWEGTLPDNSRPQGWLKRASHDPEAKHKLTSLNPDV